MQRADLPAVIDLWPAGTPGTGLGAEREQETLYASPRFNNLVKNLRVVRNIPQPTLTIYLPDPAVANGTAVIICPGGGFQCLPIDHEGTAVAQWLTKRGVAAGVLRYRLLPTAPRDEDFLQQLQHPDLQQMMSHAVHAVLDGKQAIRVMRKQAALWGVDPQLIGILGFSAGGVVATGVAAPDEADSRPNFVASMYSPGWPDGAVPADRLPLFLAFASDDPVLSLVSEGSLRFYAAWQAAGHPVELHIYSRGGHGFGMAQQGWPSDHWIERLREWLQVEGLLR
jgi:acetyl esterase/lipase